MDPTRWPLALSSRSAVQQHPSDVHQPYRRTRMSHSASLLIAATLIFAAGCAKQDWIDRTLVTVDVTGTWYGYGTSSATTSGGMSGNVEIWLELEQEGSRVKGSYRQKPDQSSNVSGPIEGTVSGDVFRYRLLRGSSDIELTVSGDEMNGQTSDRRFSLRRVNSSSPPASPPR
jgi:hypothetical protein